MPNETPTRSSGTPDGRGHHGVGAGEQSPLQARAAFFKNRHWESVVGFNRGACARGGAQHGPNPEGYEATRREWEEWRCGESSLREALGFLKGCHRRAPFLFFNGNTFADVARNMTDLLFADLPSARRREVISAAAHFVAGVLDEESMVAIVNEVCRSASFGVGDRVKTMRGSLRGVITRVLEDGRVAVRADGGASELFCLPESLLPED